MLWLAITKVQVVVPVEGLVWVVLEAMKTVTEMRQWKVLSTASQRPLKTKKQPCVNRLRFGVKLLLAMIQSIVQQITVCQARIRPYKDDLQDPLFHLRGIPPQTLLNPLLSNMLVPLDLQNWGQEAKYLRKIPWQKAQDRLHQHSARILERLTALEETGRLVIHSMHSLILVVLAVPVPLLFLHMDLSFPLRMASIHLIRDSPCPVKSVPLILQLNQADRLHICLVVVHCHHIAIVLAMVSLDTAVEKVIKARFLPTRNVYGLSLGVWSSRWATCVRLLTFFGRRWATSGKSSSNNSELNTYLLQIRPWM